jgi:hypothetical protein
VRDRFRVLALGAILASWCGCGARAPSPAAAPAAAGKGAPSRLAYEVTPSRLLPELWGPRGVVATEEGQQRVLVDRMRLLARADGSLERAAELLPAGVVTSTALPSRLGGGYLFHVNAGGGTELWRAAGWLAKLRPLTRRGEVVSDIVPGFDRLYVRLRTGNRVIALNAQTGDQMSVGPLPTAGAYGALAFADGWRAVVDADLRGPLATFDAGLTWRPLNLGERSLGVGIFDGDPGVLVAGGRYVVDARGGVSHRTDARDKGAPREHTEEPAPSVEARKAGPLGRRPLRAAVEDGWPDSKTTAVVARGGALARVSLADGAVVAMVEDAYPERRASCHAVRLGLLGVGFLCGERDGPTVVYELAPPLGLRQVLRYEKPRFIAASGNGALVIRGRCDGDASVDDSGAHWHCVRSPAGVKREIQVTGFDAGVERVVGLGDGRVAVLIPPRGGSPGDLTVISASGRATKVELKLPEAPAGVANELRHGLWLDGFEERAPGVLGGWIEAGGPVVGVQITLDGVVKAGELQGEASGAVFGGRFAVLLLDGRALETTDGGMTWAGFDLPPRAEEARAVPSRAAGPVGAALPGWIRVGWGEPEAPDDMKSAEEPSSPYTPLKVSPTIALDCEVSGVSTPPLPDKPRAAAPPPPVVVRRSPRAPVPVARPARDVQPGWGVFRNTAPPALAAEEYGVDNGDVANLRAYAWGKKGADWSRTGRWLIRFDDRFDPAGGVRAAALTASPWVDEAAALEAIGSGVSSYGTANWAGVIDPAGHALLASACRGASCALYAVGEGQPVLQIRDASGKAGGFLRPLPHGAVRLGETWFFLGKSPSYDALTLWRVELGAARTIGAYYRPNQSNNFEEPRLVRRALGGGVGLLMSGTAEPGERKGSWYVLPVNTETGELGEAVVIGRRDFAGSALTKCAPEQDGWLLDVEVSAETAVAIDVDNARAQIDPVEMRVRLDPDRACVDGFAARSGAFYPVGARAAGKGPAVPLTAAPGRSGGAVERTIPLAATEKATGRRWGLSCRIKPRGK